VKDHALLAAINLDRSLGSAVLFDHRHPDESPQMHVEIMDLWQCADEFVIVEAFREGGKTTIAEEFLTMAGCFANFYYCLLIGETYEKACDRLAAIDYECRTNEKLARLFGGKVLARKSIENKLWFKHGSLIQAFGWDQELQSFKHNEHRPDFAFLDDPENKDRVRSTEAVDESMRKLYLELIPAMDKHRRRIRFSETRRAQDCMVTRLSVNPRWLYRAFPICNGDPADPETKSNWPSRYPMEWVRDEQMSFQKAGMLAEFNQAYMLQATDAQSKPFKLEMLRSMASSPWQFMPKYSIYDPSRTANRTRKVGEHEKSDRTGHVVVSRFGSQILVHESGGDFWKPNEMMDAMFADQRKHQNVKMGVEKNSLDDWILQPLRIQMMRTGESLPLVPLQAPQDRSKEVFIQGLLPFAIAKDIVLIGGVEAHPQLVAEWQNFPSGPRDVMNALAYSLRMFAGVPMYEDFRQENIGPAPEPRRGEDVFVCWNATPDTVVAVALQREGRRIHVARDWVAAGAFSDAVKTLAFEIRTAFPNCALQTWCPAEIHDQWQRIPLIPALKVERFTPMRGEHCAPARGALAERMRVQWHGKRMLIVDERARLTLNSLAAGYALPADPSGRAGSEPEAGVSRLVAEALETTIGLLDRMEDQANQAIPKGANVGISPSGRKYVTSSPPRARA
jgi:hypothetical protein